MRKSISDTIRIIPSLFKKNKTPDIQYIHLDETVSTNDYLRTLPGNDGETADGQGDRKQDAQAQPRMTVAWTDFQTAGRGQGTNKWESERGKNLLFSILCHPVMLPLPMQFIISEAHALALYDTLSQKAEGFSIKWPNDIYWHNQKVCGTLIENRIHGGHIYDCIIGTGVNVNQQTFCSDAPNPISLYQILGQETDREALLHEIVTRFDEYLQCIVNGDYGTIAGRYMSFLYRRHGFFTFRDSEGEFEAAIVEVEDNGHLVLRDHEGCTRIYAFKEVEFVIPTDDRA